MNNLIDTEMINSSNFDYSQLDEMTSNELQEVATNISASTSNMKYLIGEQLNKAQEILAKRGYGCFVDWIESYGLKRQTAYNCINYYKVFVQNLEKQKDLKQLSDSKIYELAKLEVEQQKDVLEKVNLKDMTTREVKELTRQLKEEQEYSEELQQAIKEKDRQIQKLEQMKNEPQIIEKEVIKEIKKEVVPDRIQEKIKQLENDKEELRNKLEKSESALKSVRLESKVEQDDVYYKNNLDLLLVNIKEFLDRASKYTYFKEELQKIPKQKKRFIEKGVASVKDWVTLMEQALNNREDVLGNIIYGEGEIIDE